jgi:hypothetical protein
MKPTTALLLTLWACPLLNAQEHPKFEIFGGYSLEHISTCGAENADCSYSSDGPAAPANFNGWDASFTDYFYKFVGVTADFSGHRGTSEQVNLPISVSRYSYMFGPVVAARTKEMSAFAHFLLGGVSNNYQLFTAESYSVFAWAAGGGLDINASRHLAVRLAQVDYERVRTPVRTGSLPPVNGYRFSVGVVFKF